MSVLTVAKESAGGTQSTNAASTRTNGQSSSTEQSIDIAARAQTAVEDFISGAIPGRSGVTIDWGALSPFFSVIGDAAAVVSLLVGWL